jgi:hypothetical protein
MRVKLGLSDWGKNINWESWEMEEAGSNKSTGKLHDEELHKLWGLHLIKAGHSGRAV